MPVGVVAFSFALRDRSLEPNPSNAALAKGTLQTVKQLRGPVLIVAQWEIARGLERLGHPADLVVEPRADGEYLDSKAVWHAAAALFREHSIGIVAPVAKPGLHLIDVRRMIRRDGFRVLLTRPGKVPYDRSPLNTQWWTRSPVRLLAYAVLQFIHRPRQGSDGGGRRK